METNTDKSESTQPEKSAQTASGTTKKGGFMGFIKKYPIIFTALMGLLAVTIVYFFKDYQAKNQKAVIEKRATEQLEQNNHELLMLMCKPLVWSIRAEMLRGNLDQVNTFTSDLVKEKNFQFIHLVDPNGTIIVSTDKKMEGQSAIGFLDPALLGSDSVVFQHNTQIC